MARRQPPSAYWATENPLDDLETVPAAELAAWVYAHPSADEVADNETSRYARPPLPEI